MIQFAGVISKKPWKRKTPSKVEASRERPTSASPSLAQEPRPTSGAIVAFLVPALQIPDISALRVETP